MMRQNLMRSQIIMTQEELQVRRVGRRRKKSFVNWRQADVVSSLILGYFAKIELVIDQ